MALTEKAPFEGTVTDLAAIMGNGKATANLGIQQTQTITASSQNQDLGIASLPKLGA